MLKMPKKVYSTTPEISDAFKRYRNYLQACYQNNLKMWDDKLSIAPCCEFIDVTLVHITSGSQTGATSLDLDTILIADSRFVLVEGTPGMGKSTLCCELCRKWDDLKSLQDYKIVLLLKLHEMRVQNSTSLNEIFNHMMIRSCQRML